MLVSNPTKPRSRSRDRWGGISANEKASRLADDEVEPTDSGRATLSGADGQLATHDDVAVDVRSIARAASTGVRREGGSGIVRSDSSRLEVQSRRTRVGDDEDRLARRLVGHGDVNASGERTGTVGHADDAPERFRVVNASGVPQGITGNRSLQADDPA